MRDNLLLWAVAISAVAYAVRTVLLLAFGRRAPGFTLFVDRWWPWTAVAVMVLFLVSVQPAIGLLAAALAALSMRYTDWWSFDSGRYRRRRKSTRPPAG